MQSPGLEYLMMLLVVCRIEDVSSDHEHTHPVLRNFQSWVSDKFSSESLEDPQALKSFLKIVFARLNTLRSEIPCGRHGGGADARSDNSNHLDRVEHAIVEQNI
ncbi:hypothetical protein DPMN_158422 [Dreissena polymorpha]|uniref:Uncharacterized protein n=1 Tax=Dreissena polymorpha TaxID=45954 RepID=A0A9D4IPS6_DREPO|nr:hypothetical protein DPMN_158422 [Dreissena polymorpha]